MSKRNIQCKRCLLREIGQKDALEQVMAYQQRIPLADRINDEEKEVRLSICKDCKWLRFGVCQKSGYYVEAVAADKTKHCPLGEHMW